jgi:hypothetical protein
LLELLPLPQQFTTSTSLDVLLPTFYSTLAFAFSVPLFLLPQELLLSLIQLITVALEPFTSQSFVLDILFPRGLFVIVFLMRLTIV